MLIYIYVVRMDIEDTRKGIYLFKGNGSFLEELIPLSHIIVVLPSIMESPLVVRIQRNKIYILQVPSAIIIVRFKIKYLS